MPDLDFANAALSLLGEPELNSLTDDRKAARVIAPRIARTRDALLRSHPWNFATRRALLNKLATSPPFGFANTFGLPADYLRVLAMNDGEDDFRIESQDAVKVLLTDADTVQMVYTARISEPALWDPLFFEAAAAGLALNVAVALHGSDNPMVNRVRALFLDRLRLARSIDGQENPPYDVHQDDFLGARFGTGFFRAISSV